MKSGRYSNQVTNGGWASRFSRPGWLPGRWCPIKPQVRFCLSSLGMKRNVGSVLYWHHF